MLKSLADDQRSAVRPRPAGWDAILRFTSAHARPLKFAAAFLFLILISAGLYRVFYPGDRTPAALSRLADERIPAAEPPALEPVEAKPREAEPPASRPPVQEREEAQAALSPAAAPPVAGQMPMEAVTAADKLAAVPPQPAEPVPEADTGLARAAADRPSEAPASVKAQLQPPSSGPEPAKRPDPSTGRRDLAAPESRRKRAATPAPLDPALAGSERELQDVQRLEAMLLELKILEPRAEAKEESLGVAQVQDRISPSTRPTGRRTFAGKTFYQVGDLWVDSQILGSSASHVVKVTFTGALQKDADPVNDPFAYLPLGDRVVVSLRGRVYLVTRR